MKIKYAFLSILGNDPFLIRLSLVSIFPTIVSLQNGSTLEDASPFSISNISINCMFEDLEITSGKISLKTCY